jgi:hypothetical protein
MSAVTRTMSRYTHNAGSGTTGAACAAVSAPRRGGRRRRRPASPNSQPLPDLSLLAWQLAGEYPNIAAMLEGVSHEADTTLGWCDDQFEFEFALDLLLDGLARLRDLESGTAKKQR